VKTRLLVALVCSLPLAAGASDAFFASEVLDAAALKQAPRDAADAAWQGAPAKSFLVVPQRTVRLHDRRANEVAEAPGGKADVSVRAALVGGELVLRLEWRDAAREVVRDDEVNVFADSAAVQVPQRFGPGVRLPAISMGDGDAPVRLWLLRAVQSGAVQSELVAAGFGSSTRGAAPQPAPRAMSYDEAAKAWRAMFRVPVAANAAGLVPVAFALWDGARHERSGNKRLSAWKFVRLPGRPLDAAYVKELAWGYAPGDLGDAARGKQLAETMCIACHRLPGKAFAPVGLAPMLEDIGAIATPGYLRDSIVKPSEVVLHAPNPNQHYDKNAARDPNGAYPNQEAFKWGTQGPDGKWVSKMPPYAAFTPEQVGDLVAFLRTLQGD
jgi:complex iron-sulfur molybdoenzyme family reductase subunit gamma